MTGVRWNFAVVLPVLLGWGRGEGEARLSDTNCLIIHLLLFRKEVLEAGEDLGSLGLEAESPWLRP